MTDKNYKYRLWRYGTGTRPGVSLFIGLIIVSLVTVFSAIVTNVVISSIQQSSNVNRANESFFGAEGALEVGLKVNRESGAGFTSEEPVEQFFGGGVVDGGDYLEGQPPTNYECLFGSDYAMCLQECTSSLAEEYVNNSPGLDEYCKNSCQSCLGAPSSGSQTTLTSDVKARYEVRGRVPAEFVYGVNTKFQGNYNIPAPGTGNVGRYCDELNPPISKTESGLQYPPMDKSAEPIVFTDPSDNPCNWSKIKVGETITIPLYFVDASGTIVPFLKTDGTSASMIVRMRAPCINGYDWCNFMGRFRLADARDSSLKEALPYNDPMVSWQIVTEKTAEEPSYVLSAISEFASPDDNELNDDLSTVILESAINNALNDTSQPFQIFNLTDAGAKGRDLEKCEGTVKDFLLASSGSCWSGKTINKPVLKLSVIGNLMGIGQGKATKLPYLEYQIITSAFSGTESPTDAVQTITAEGYSGTFKQVLEVKQPQSGGLLEYVIQQ